MRGVGFLFVVCTGCAGSLEVTRTVSPSEADPKLEALAIVRGAERIELPKGAHVEGGRAVLAAGTVATVALDRGDVVVRDEGGRIASVRSGDVVTVRFAPETAEMIDASSVRGEIADVPLRAGDAIEVHGTFAPGDALPGGGRVESSRMTNEIHGDHGVRVSLVPTGLGAAAVGTF